MIENFSKGKSSSGQFESLVLDTARKPELAEFRVDNKTRCGHVVAMTPAFDIAETNEPVAVQSHNSLAAFNLVDYVLGRAAGDACAALKG